MKTRCLVSLILVATFVLLCQPAIADDLAELKATHMKMNKAINTGDVETFFDLTDDYTVMFGPDTGIPHALPGKEIKERVKQAFAKWYETHTNRTMWYKPDYRVIGNTGLVWGLVERTITNKQTGVTQKLFLKISLTYVKSDGKWISVLSHSSSIPTTQTLP